MHSALSGCYHESNRLCHWPQSVIFYASKLKVMDKPSSWKMAIKVALSLVMVNSIQYYDASDDRLIYRWKILKRGSIADIFFILNACLIHNYEEMWI